MNLSFRASLTCMLATITTSRIFGRRGVLLPASLLVSSTRAFAVPSGNVLLTSSSVSDISSSVIKSSTTALYQEKEGKTGWNHNLPSESSGFWDSDTSSSSSRGEPQSQEQAAESEPRTGWLHNTVSKSEQQAASSSSSPPAASGQARRRLEMAMKNQARNHRILGPPTFHATGSKRLVVTEHWIRVPVVYSDDSSDIPTTLDKKTVDVYFSITEAVTTTEAQAFFESLADLSPSQRAQKYVTWAGMQNADSCALYLQGGPGFGAPTPVVGLGFGSEDSSWAAKALSKYKRVVLMDQRGTGRSTPITKQTLELNFPDLFLLDDNTEEEKVETIQDLQASSSESANRVQAALTAATDYLAQFRADNIVKDAEVIRDALLLPDETKDANDLTGRPWGCALGQSFGGFCMMTYLSQVADPPKVCLFTGGIAPMCTPLDEAYASLWTRVRQRSLLYYDMYPGDIELVQRIVRKLEKEPAALPAGGILTGRRFLQLGLALGGSPSSFASLHALFSSALIPTDSDNDDNDDDSYVFSRAFLKRVESDQSFDDHPIYFWLHESIYANAQENAPTNWSAHRMLPDDFDHVKNSQPDSKEPVLFYGEMVFPWMTEDYAELNGTGVKLLADALAAKNDWNALYNEANMKAALAGRSKAAAAVYYGDMYVDFKACERVLAGPLEKCKPYITNDYQHSGLRDDGARIFDKLHGMAMGSVRTPS